MKRLYKVNLYLHHNFGVETKFVKTIAIVENEDMAFGNAFGAIERKFKQILAGEYKDLQLDPGSLEITTRNHFIVSIKTKKYDPETSIHYQLPVYHARYRQVDIGSVLDPIDIDYYDYRGFRITISDNKTNIIRNNILFKQLDGDDFKKALEVIDEFFND